MSLVLVGTNHNYSPVEFREKICFSKKSLRSSLDFLKKLEALKGAVILSTCNRVEIYSSSDDEELTIEEIKKFISVYHEIDTGSFSSYLYIYKGVDALRHLFSVTCGLDSLVPGESQILGQVKAAFTESIDKDFLDSFLKAVFYSATSFADNAHSNNKIFREDISIGAIAIDFIKETLGDLSGKNILFIGTGKVIELIVKRLKKETPNVIFIANRTFWKAKELAIGIKAKAVRFDELKKFLNTSDVIITATRSPRFIIKPEMLEHAINRKILIIDLAMPRDVDPGVKDINGVELFYLEDLRHVIEKNTSGRASEIGKLKNLIEIEAEKSWKKLIELDLEPALSL